MPQLDLMIYFPQFIWFSLGFSAFYMIFLYKIIPAISFSIKFRKKKLDFIRIHLNQKNLNFLEIFDHYFNVLSKTLQLSCFYLNKNSLNISSCIGLIFKNIDILLFKVSHKLLLDKLMKIYLQMEIRLNKLKSL